MTLPLADVRILAVEQYGAGPWGTLQLADMGADVIKVEDPAGRGDIGRYVPPFQEGEDSLFFETFNRNKRSISLDLRHPHARQVLRDLATVVDVVYSNLRGDLPRRLGLTYEQLMDVNPRIVCCSLSAYGMTGPRAGQAGYDYMMQGLAGWMSLAGAPHEPPSKSGLSLVDLSGGYVAAIAVLAGLWRARRDGIGCDCDISLFETALAELMYVGTWAASRGYVPPRRSNSAHPSIVPFQNFQTADGWIVVACPKEKFWTMLCEVVGRPALARDPRYRDFAARDRNRDSLITVLEAVFRTRPSARWLEALTAAGVPCSAVNTVADALMDPQVKARTGIVEYEHPSLGAVRQVASPLRVGAETRAAGPAPARGADTEDVLSVLCGYSAARITELADLGVFGETPSAETEAV